jgi:hypothetical protein
MVLQSPKGKSLSGWGAGYGWCFCALIYRKLWEDELAGTKLYKVVGYCGGSWLSACWGSALRELCAALVRGNDDAYGEAMIVHATAGGTTATHGGCANS